MKIAFLFPGQGAQNVGMGKDLYNEYEEAKKIYNKVNEITGINISKISFEGPEETLNETKYTQLAILTNSLAILEILKKENIKADILAGLSLGEYTALIHSKCLSFEQGVKLVQKRGEYMQNLAPKGNWQMAAIMGLEDEKVEEVCKKVKSGFVVPVNYNTIGQVVVSGEQQAVEEAQKIAKEAGAKKIAVLKTSGPFHTEKLIESSKALRKELESVTFNKFETKVVKNLDGELYKDTDDIKEILAKHIINPVKFSKAINTMLLEGIDTFIEIGPGKTLSGFVKRSQLPKGVNKETAQNETNQKDVIKKEENQKEQSQKEIKIMNISNVDNLKETISYINENI